MNYVTYTTYLQGIPIIICGMNKGELKLNVFFLIKITFKLHFHLNGSICFKVIAGSKVKMKTSKLQLFVVSHLLKPHAESP